MRKTIVFGALAALFGFAALAQVGGGPRTEMREGTQVTRPSAAKQVREAVPENHDALANQHRDPYEGHDAGEDENADHGGGPGPTTLANVAPACTVEGKIVDGAAGPKCFSAAGTADKALTRINRQPSASLRQDPVTGCCKAQQDVSTGD